MIVCHCEVVTDRDVADAVLAGARSVSQVCRSTGAGRDCGSCVFALKRLVGEERTTLAPHASAGGLLVGVDGAAS